MLSRILQQGWTFQKMITVGILFGVIFGPQVQCKQKMVLKQILPNRCKNNSFGAPFWGPFWVPWAALRSLAQPIQPAQPIWASSQFISQAQPSWRGSPAQAKPASQPSAKAAKCVMATQAESMKTKGKESIPIESKSRIYGAGGRGRRPFG